MKEWRLSFTCELQEDLHSGSGVGRLKTIDRCHARDRAGRPVVWHTTLRGLLRDAADDLHMLGHGLAKRLETVVRLYGREGSEGRSSVVCRSLHFQLPEAERSGPFARAFSSVTSTSREAYSRRALDTTLRTTEYSATGLRATGEIRLIGDEDDLELLKLCLQHIMSLGGGKERGPGRILIRGLPERLREAGVDAPTESIPPKGKRRLRLVLKSLEPLCIPATGHPGNMIPGESFLPGQALRGAWFRAITAHSPSEATFVDRLAEPGGTGFSNGYYVPASLVEEMASKLGSLCSIPLPVTARELKPTERPITDGAVPWWATAESDSSVWLERPEDEQDLLWQKWPNEDEEGGECEWGRLKRVKREEYLVAVNREGTRFRRVRPDLCTIMRNRVPVGRQERRFDSRRVRSGGDSSEEDLNKSELFSETVLAEEQHFVADILFSDDETAHEFSKKAAPFLAGDVSQRSWLRLGRGGRPVVVEHWTWLPGEVAARSGTEGLETVRGEVAFSLTLTSDLIARASDLTFLTDLSAADLGRLCGFRDSFERISVRSVCEVREVHGFNTASGARRSPALAIKRGSTFRVQSGCSEKLGLLYGQLVAIERGGQGIGERTEEGFGRFVLNHAAHRSPAEKAEGDWTPSREPASREAEWDAQRRRVREEILGRVLKGVEEIGLVNACQKWENVPKDFPARSQWQQLCHMAEVLSTKGQLESLLSELCEHAKRLSGRMWACELRDGDDATMLCDDIDRLWRAAGDFQAQRTFLVHLCRWVINRLNALADEKRRAERGEPE